MCGSIVCIAAALLGIDAGWRPLPEGGVEYLIQIEPQVLERLKSGESIQSDIPPHVKNVRAYKITVGRDTLPRELPPADVDSSGSAAATPDKTPADPLLPRPQTPSIRPEMSSMLPPLRQPGSGPPAVPKPIEPDPASEPIITQQAAHLEQTKATPLPESKPTADQQSQEEEGEPGRPWLPLTLMLFGLFASLGGNVFLGWITWDTRSRYRTLLRGAGSTPGHAP